jgi:hypothetical protein
MIHEAITLEANNSPFLLHMNEIYNEVQKTYAPKGAKPAVHKARVALFNKLLGSGKSGPYLAIKTHIGTKIKTLIPATEADFNRHLVNVFAKIGRDFDLVCPEQEDGGLGVLDLGKGLLEVVTAVKQVLEGDAREALLEAGLRVD